MKLWVHPYVLKISSQSHHGVLFKFEFTEKLTGFADLHPWPELGDLSLQEQLAQIKRGEFSPQFRKTMLHAQIDAQSRLDKKNLFSDLKIPRSHFFASHPEVMDNIMLRYIQEQGFKTIKMKIVDLKTSLKTIKNLIAPIGRSDMKLRLDFNSRFPMEQVLEFFENLSEKVEFRNYIDFVEDPATFEEKGWQNFKTTFGLALALDRELKNVPAELKLKMKSFADVIVFKPALELVEEVSQLAVKNNLKVVVTTNLDHALGVMSAVWEAGLLNKKHPELIKDCGLISHGEFDDDGFFSKIKTIGAFYQSMDFYGFGFEDELAKLKWDFFL